MGGMKYDNEKPRTDLIPPSSIFSMGRGFKYGADKYDDRNWEEGIEYGRLFGALMRHLWAWWNGENIDPESGLSHLDHAFCNLAMLNEMQNIHPELDNRPSKSNKFNIRSFDSSGYKAGTEISEDKEIGHE